MKKFEDVDYHYVYTVNFDTKTVMEYQVKDYDVDHLASKVVRIIMSYTGYINRTVWKKY